jgi:hypothetical protein
MLRMRIEAKVKAKARVVLSSMFEVLRMNQEPVTTNYKLRTNN